MKTNDQLIKKAKETGNYQNIYPIAYIDGIIDKESNEKLSDILIRYNHILVPWQGSVVATRNRVTLLMRRQGLWITYLNEDSEIVTEVYKGSAKDIITNWADDINWEIIPDMEYVQNNASKIPDGAILPQHLSKELQEMLLSSGKVTNLPDNEDLTTQGIALKFKDREYNPEQASGKGYKILRKNWTIVDNNNINLLTQEMINDIKTVYEIRYDFNLNGQTINIPNGSILDFKGGSLNNGTINFPEGTYIRNLYKGTATITGNPTYIDYLADEEDVTTENGILKFKDKEYSSSDFSGLGRKYLRKNIVDDKNILTQDMVNSTNTIYIIQYDYDLNEETITIPEGCVLQFEGGSLSNGTLHGTNTSILTGISYIFNNMAFDGDWKVPFIYPEYFGAKGDGVTDDRDAIQKSLDSNISNTIKLLQKTYIIKSYITLEEYNYGIVIPTRKILLGSNTSNYTKDSKILISKDIDVFAFIKLKDRNTTIKDILVEGELKEDGSLIFSHGICTGVGSFAYIILENVKVKNCGRNGFDLGTYLSNIKLCNADTCGLYGFYIHGGPGKNTSNVLESCYSCACKMGGYYLDRMTYVLLNNCAADHCGFDNNSLSNDNINPVYTVQNCQGVVLNSCACEQSFKILKAYSNVKGLYINGGFFLLKDNKEEYPEDFDFSKIMEFDWISNSSINNSLIGRFFTIRESFPLITGTQNTSLVIEDCYLNSDNLGNYTNFKKSYINGGSITVVNNQGSKILEDAYIDNIMQFNEMNISGEVIIKTHHAIFNSKKYFNDIKGKITLLPLDSAEVNIAYSTESMSITDCDNVNFNNFSLDFTTYNDSKNALIITNSKVTFSNIKFIGFQESNKTLKMFELKDSMLILDNWSFTPSYNMSTILGDYFLLNNSTVILKNGNSLQYITDFSGDKMINNDGTLFSKVRIV